MERSKRPQHLDKKTAMTVKMLLHRMELTFWDTFIPIMDKSSFLRFALPRLYRLLHTEEFRNTVKYTILLSLFGLLLGFVIGAFTQI
jgi:hypothetical protein